MDRYKITDAVILAAGNGTRMAVESPLPKPLTQIAGQAMLDQIIERLAEAGISRVFIVLGYRGDEIRAYYEQKPAPIAVHWIENPRFHLPNGVSLLSVEGHVQAPFLLLMADHLFEFSTLRDFLSVPIPDQGGLLATDAKLDNIFDLADATKVRAEDQRVQTMGKNIPVFNAIDTGMFKLTETVFPAMRKSLSLDDGSLTGGISALARLSRVATWDIGPRRWIDVDTPAAREEAERLFMKGCFRADAGASTV